MLPFYAVFRDVSVVLVIALLIIGGLHQDPAHGSGWWRALVVMGSLKSSLTALGFSFWTLKFSGKLPDKLHWEDRRHVS